MIMLKSVHARMGHTPKPVARHLRHIETFDVRPSIPQGFRQTHRHERGLLKKGPNKVADDMRLCFHLLRQRARGCYAKVCLKTSYSASATLIINETIHLWGPAMTSLYSDTHPEIEALQIQLWRQASPTKKMNMLAQLNASAQLLALTGLRAKYPNATEKELKRALADLVLGAEQARKVFGDSPLAK